MKKTFKVVMLPFQEDMRNKCAGLTNNSHLYIVSDDEIKEGDWLIGGANDESENEVWKHDGLGYISKEDKKIVATTDKSLTLKSKCTCTESEAIYCGGSKIVGKCQQLLPQIPESFIQAYIKAYNEGKPITEVDLECELDNYNLKGNERLVNVKTRPDNTVIMRESKLYNFEDLCSLTTFIRENNFEGKGITNTEIIELWKKNGEI